MSLASHDLAAELLAWRTRSRQGIIAWQGGDTAIVRFAEHLSARRPQLHTDDVHTRVKSFAVANASYADWFAAVIAPFDKHLTFRRGAPGMSCGALGKWRALTSKFDPDALTAFAWVRSRQPRPAPGDLFGSSWGFYLPVADPALEAIFRAGLADGHVHLEACDPIPVLWLRLATGDVETKSLKFYSDRAIEALDRDHSGRERRVRDRNDLEMASALRDALLRATGFPIQNVEPALRMAEERALLLAAWEMMLDHRSRHLVGAFDQYLHCKNLFLRRHMQGAGKGTGLTRFRDFLDRGETLVEKKSKKARTSVRATRFTRMLALAREPADLRFLELRVAPQKTVRGWVEFMQLWKRRFIEAPSAPSEPLIRFVVHFIRDAKSHGSATCPMHFGALRQDLDRKTATLHAFRVKYPELARFIVGIDVANLERGCPPELFAPYLKLLRGDQALAPDLSHPALKWWRVLHERGQGFEPLSLAPLGLTYHAGEDFHHPVDGIRAVSGLEANLLRSGDRIGHGLAAGLDVAAFQTRRGHVPIPRGVLFDDLVWLRRELARTGQWLGEWYADCEKAIAALCREIYGRDHDTACLEMAIDRRFFLPSRPTNRATPEDHLIWQETKDERIWRKREAPAEDRWVDVLYAAAQYVPLLQERLIRTLMNAGVIVEANPSSNVVTGAVERFTDHPFFRFLEVLGDENIVTFNTDDPGVFGTRLDVEFALMFEAMLENGIGRRRALDITDRIRRLGIDASFCNAAR